MRIIKEDQNLLILKNRMSGPAVQKFMKNKNLRNYNLGKTIRHS